MARAKKQTQPDTTTTNTNDTSNEGTQTMTVSAPQESIHASTGPVGARIREILGGFRATGVESAQTVCAKLIAGDSEAAAALASLPVLIAGQGLASVSQIASGETPIAIDAPLAVSILGRRGVVIDGEKQNADIGLTVYPDFTVESILAHTKGNEYLHRLAVKEMGHTAHNALGDKAAPLADLATAAESMPSTLDDFLVRSVVRGGGAFAVFDDNWQAVRKVFESHPATSAVAKAMPNKGDMLKAIRSKHFAESAYPVLEGQGRFVQIAENMVKLIQHTQARAAAKGEDQTLTGDPSQITAWLADRDNLVIESNMDKVKASDAEPDFDALFGAMDDDDDDDGDES